LVKKAIVSESEHPEWGRGQSVFTVLSVHGKAGGYVPPPDPSIPTPPEPALCG
jgi:hypothetical protein